MFQTEQKRAAKSPCYTAAVQCHSSRFGWPGRLSFRRSRAADAVPKRGKSCVTHICCTPKEWCKDDAIKMILNAKSSGSIAHFHIIAIANHHKQRHEQFAHKLTMKVFTAADHNSRRLLHCYLQFQNLTYCVCSIFFVNVWKAYITAQGHLRAFHKFNLTQVEPNTKHAHCMQT